MSRWLGLVGCVLLVAACSNQPVVGPPSTPEDGLFVRPPNYVTTTTTAITFTTNAIGRVVGDPFTQCWPVWGGHSYSCRGDPDFVWNPANLYEGVPGEGFLDDGVLLSSRDKRGLTIGFELSPHCAFIDMYIHEGSDAVIIGLEYTRIRETDQCLDDLAKFAVRKFLDEPLGERELVFAPLKVSSP